MVLRPKSIDAYTREIEEIKVNIYDKYGHNRDVTHYIWSYSAMVRTFISLLDNKELYELWKNQLKLFNNDKLSLEELKAKLEEANRLYRTGDESPLSDAQYDFLLEQIKDEAFRDRVGY